MRMLTREEIPCWYELSWHEEGPAIVLRIHRDIVEDIKIIPDDAPIVAHFKEEFGFADFSGNLNEDFGFERVFLFQGKKNDFTQFLIPIPVIKKETDELCERCQGSGKDEYREERDCLSCNGSCKEYIFDWQSAFGISASFTVLSAVLRFPEKTTSAPFPQLLTVETITQKGMHGGSLGGEYSISLCRLLASLGSGADIPEMVRAMKAAYGRMLGLTDFDGHRFRACVDYDSGWLNVDCPGDACGLHPSSHDIRQGEGYEFSCHNVDSPAQQITLLAGLAALHDRARKEIGRFSP